MVRKLLGVLLLVSVLLPVGVSQAQSTDPSGRFTDDDGHFSEPALEALASRGMLDATQCGVGMICPDDPILRWKIAVWLVRALDGSGPPSRSGGTGFSDVPSDQWWAPYVDRLAAIGVTKGCGNNRFCPFDPVTRGQMASFLVRAFDIEPGGPLRFADAARSAHSDAIAALDATNITAGCGTFPARFCPEADVTIGEMGVLLASGLDLIPRPSPATNRFRIGYEVRDPGPRFHSVQLWVVESDGGNPRHVADHFYKHYTTAALHHLWSPDGSSVLYVTTDTPNRGVDESNVAGELWAIDLDGTNRRKIDSSVFVGLGEDSPAGWSADGKHVFYSTSDQGAPIWVLVAGGRGFLPPYAQTFVTVSPDGSNRTEATPPVDTSWWDLSPDQTEIVYDYSGGEYEVPVASRLAVIGVDGSGIRTLGAGESPVWSPDGSMIAYNLWTNSGFEVWVIDSDGRNPRMVAERGQFPRWSPDGTRIAYVLRWGGIGVADSRGDKTWTVAGIGYDPRWSPDGTLVSYSYFGRNLYDDYVAIAEVDRYRERMISGGLRLVWSPDGSMIAYHRHSEDDEERGIWVTDLAGNSRKVTDHGENPIWLPVLEGR